jgi:hypothetical protein
VSHVKVKPTVREENADDLIIHLFVTHFGGRRVIRTKAVGGGVFCVWAREKEREGLVLVRCVQTARTAARRAHGRPARWRFIVLPTPHSLLTV